jgi:regulator of sigma E protease
MSGFLLAAVVYVVPILLILTLIVTVHELGHFLVAKSFKVAIDRFSIGFGRAIATWTDRSGVEWRIGMIPLGGYVRFAGDTNDASVPDAEDLAEMRRQIEEKLGAEAVSRFYAFKPLWQRALIAAAGPMANFILAIAIFAAVLMAGVLGRVPPVVSDVVPNSPAAAAGFKPGDVVVEADGRAIHYFNELQTFVRLRANEEVRITVRRGGEDRVLLATPRSENVSDGLSKRLVPMGTLGLVSSERAVFRNFGPIEAIGEGARLTGQQIDTTLTYITRIFTGREDGSQISGIIGMGHASGAIAKQSLKDSSSAAEFAYRGGLNLILMAASISIGIGFVNLLPIPMLDGGHLVFYAYEAIARRPVQARVQAASYRVGLALVLGLMLFATWNDLQRLQVFQFLGGMFS